MFTGTELWSALYRLDWNHNLLLRYVRCLRPCRCFSPTWLDSCPVLPCRDLPILYAQSPECGGLFSQCFPRLHPGCFPTVNELSSALMAAELFPSIWLDPVSCFVMSLGPAPCSSTLIFSNMALICRKWVTGSIAPFVLRLLASEQQRKRLEGDRETERKRQM